MFNPASNNNNGNRYPTYPNKAKIAPASKPIVNVPKQPRPSAWQAPDTMGGTPPPKVPSLAKDVGPGRSSAVGPDQFESTQNPLAYKFKPTNPDRRIDAKWMGYAAMTTEETVAAQDAADAHEFLVGPNIYGKPAPKHIQTHELLPLPPEKGFFKKKQAMQETRLLTPHREGKGPAETGQVYLRPENGRLPLQPLYSHPTLGAGKCDGKNTGVGLGDHPRAIVTAHTHPFLERGCVHEIPSPDDFYHARSGGHLGASTQTPPGVRQSTSIINTPAVPYVHPTKGEVAEPPQFIRIGHDHVHNQDVYWTLTSNPDPGNTPPASPTSFNPPLPGVRDYPSGPPGPYRKVHPAGPDHISNQPGVTSYFGAPVQSDPNRDRSRIQEFKIPPIK